MTSIQVTQEKYQSHNKEEIAYQFLRSTAYRKLPEKAVSK